MRVELKLDWLKEQAVCEEAIAWVETQKDKDIFHLYAQAKKRNKLDWANWCVARLLDRKNRIRYAIFAAEQVLHIFEKQYPEDQRPRKAIEAAKRVIEDDSEENRRIAHSAAYNAGSAYIAYSADIASNAYIAHSAASIAADIAADSAYSVYNAYSAARNAAYIAAHSVADSAYKEIQTKIVDYGVKLLREQNNEKGGKNDRTRTNALLT